MPGPSHRIVAKNKSNQQTAEIGVIWTDAQGRMNMTFATEADVEKSQGGKALASKVIANQKDYFFNVYANVPRADRPPRREREEVTFDDSPVDF